MSNKIDNVLLLLKELYDYGILYNPNNLEVKDILESMYLLKRREGEYIDNENLIIELVSNYNTDELNIGGVSFYNPDDFIYLDDMLCVGSDGAGDFIACDEKNIIYNLIDDGTKIEIANSGEKFIEKLTEVGKFNFSKSNDKDALNNVLNKISDNEKARGFYLSLMS
ncbi:hypothetical protein [Flavobacterium columnare]|uniref:hypothetical protein n=1 Tax=Flavobacterium columnare TaxID=996 RepID=UPI000D1B21A1|nr:hypothetical protein [Flavobacterium columnare]PTD14273.1 hypothetical protein C6N29_07420 [Flavobacterium columnare]